MEAYYCHLVRNNIVNNLSTKSGCNNLPNLHTTALLDSEANVSFLQMAHLTNCLQKLSSNQQATAYSPIKLSSCYSINCLSQQEKLIVHPPSSTTLYLYPYPYSAAHDVKSSSTTQSKWQIGAKRLSSVTLF